MIAAQRAGLPVNSPDVTRPDLSDPEAALNELATEMSNIDVLLTENLNIRLAWRRNLIWSIGWIFFRFNTVAARVISITCTITITCLAEFFAEGFLKEWPKFFITLAVGLLSGFSLDLLIEKYATRYFWRNAEHSYWLGKCKWPPSIF